MLCACDEGVADLRRYVRHREPLLMGVMLAHVAETGLVQIPLLAKQLGAARLADPFWFARVASIEARPRAPSGCTRHAVPSASRKEFCGLSGPHGHCVDTQLPLSRPACPSG